MQNGSGGERNGEEAARISTIMIGGSSRETLLAKNSRAPVPPVTPTARSFEEHVKEARSLLPPGLFAYATGIYSLQTRISLWRRRKSSSYRDKRLESHSLRGK